MFFNFKVDVPDAPGKITYKTKYDGKYVFFEYGRKYNSEKKYNVPQRSIIGKMADNGKMFPNANFIKYFPDTELPEEKPPSRSSCIKIGAFLILRRILKEYKLDEYLKEFVSDSELFLDFVIYSIITEDNVAQYYPDYAYNHPLLTPKMHQYSDSKLSDYFNSFSEDDSTRFLNWWNSSRNMDDQIYISYDSTNKNSQAGEIEMVEYGHPKDDENKPIVNYAIAYDTTNQEPLFYEEYLGSVVDVSQLQYMLEKAKGYGYTKIGFILDRGYFSKKNIQYMDKCNYDFIIMVKGMANLVNSLILEVHGTFEEKRSCFDHKYRVYGTTVKRKLYEEDEKERYFHIYYSPALNHKERDDVEMKVSTIAGVLAKYYGTNGETPGAENYFEIERDKDNVILLYKEKTDVVEREIKLCGYFVIITSTEMTAQEALDFYKSRDTSEKLFRGDKSFLGGHSLHVYYTESAKAKLFIEFVALIVRHKMYRYLRDEKLRLDTRPNYMTVPAAIRELEKIELIKENNGIYHLDHAVTAKQKSILKAFGLNAAFIKREAQNLSDQLAVIDGLKD